MMRTVAFIFTFATLILVTTGEKVENIDLNINLVFPETVSKEDGKVCSVDEVETFSHKYHNCFLDKKYKDGGQDLENLVARIWALSKTCVENATRSCRPNLKGFIAMMDQVIYQVKDYFQIYLEHIHKERTNIKDLKCVEDLLISTYQSCFKGAFEEVADTSSTKFQLKVESAISCTNKSHKSCSRSAQTSLNRVVRQILDVEQPKKEDMEEEVKQPRKEDIKEEVKQPKKEDIKEEVKQPKKEDIKEEVKQTKNEDIEEEVKQRKKDIEEEVKQPEPPKRWYDSILQPFISMWRSIRAFFGF